MLSLSTDVGASDDSLLRISSACGTPIEAEEMPETRTATEEGAETDTGKDTEAHAAEGAGTEAATEAMSDAASLMDCTAS